MRLYCKFVQKRKLKKKKLHDMLSTPPPLEKLIPLNRPIPPKIAIGPNPPLTEDFQKSPILPKSWGMGRGGGGGFPLCKQVSTGAPSKRSPGNMQQCHKRTPAPNCDSLS